MDDVTKILDAAERGDPQAAERLLPLVYDELRRLAARQLAADRAGHTLQATALVHEAYLRLLDGDCSKSWANRRHFFAAAAQAMRRILVESARRKDAAKRGGNLRRCDLDESALVESEPDACLLDLDDALRRLGEQDPIKAKLVELRYFAGLTGAQAADVLGMSPSTADREWVFARAWLHRELS